ncbi:MAG: AMMECR1 domain-containing protein, partial [Candidatus Hodarchaeota archaeon]
FQRGLLLPQVPVNNNWDLTTYLNYVCLKAGLPPDAWTDLDTKISCFEGLIYAEKTPNGIIEKESMN